MSHGSLGGEKPLGRTTDGPASQEARRDERSRPDNRAQRTGSYGQKYQRASSAGPPTSRERRSLAETAPQGRSIESALTGQKGPHNGGYGHSNSRRTSIATQTEFRHESRRPSLHASRESGQSFTKTTPVGTDRDERHSSISIDTHAHPRYTGAERRSEGSIRIPDSFRESNTHLHHRERGEGRSERGRGGYRGNRGGNGSFLNKHASSGQGYTNGHPSVQSPTNPQTPKSFSFNERHAPQTPSQQPSRNGSASTRSQSIPNSTAYGRFPNGPPTGVPHLPALQTDVANMYGYTAGHPGILSAMPYHPYMEQMSLLAMVSMQMYVFTLWSTMIELT